MFKIGWFLLIVLLLVAFLGESVGVESALASSTSGFFGATDDPCAYWKAVFDFAMKIAGALAFAAVLFGGLLWLISSGDSSKLEKAKDLIKGALTGLFIAFLSYVLFWALNPYLIECKIEIPAVNLVSGDYSIPDVSRCEGVKAYKSQSECEKTETKCSNKSKPCIKDKEISSSCKGDGVQVANKSECCSGKVKEEKSGSATVKKCDGTAEEKWCCSSSACGKNLVAKANKYQGTCFGPCHCAWFVSTVLKDDGCSNGIIVNVSSLESWLLKNGWKRHEGQSGVQSGDVVVNGGAHIGIHVGGGSSIHSGSGVSTCEKNCPKLAVDSEGTNKCASCEKIPQEGPSTGRFRAGKGGASNCKGNQCVKISAMKYDHYWHKD
ncbi:pilin [Patescibacteria group bacterium]|nr:pilin [Patescibacteria group bacterium]